MFVMLNSDSVSSQRLAVSSQRHSFGVRWQAQHDTALRLTGAICALLPDPKRRRRFALPAHSKLIVLLLTALCSLLTGCRRDMQNQPKSIAYRESRFYKDGISSRPLVEGTVPRGFLREDRELYLGKKSTANNQPGPVLTQPLGTSSTAPANYHQDRLRQAPVGHFFDVMTNGWGAMPSYASQIPVEDRWKIIAYIRALQLSQMPPGGNPTVKEGANRVTEKK